ncbi:E3 ubiquitin-protein ligase HTD1 [Balamuthia mandrillaris]
MQRRGFALLVAFVAVLAVAQVAAFVSENEAMTISLFKGFMAQHKKQYATEEEFNYRLTVFKSNLEVAKELQRLNPAASFGVTKFSDLTAEEFKEFYLMPSFNREDVLGEAEPLEEATVDVEELQDGLPDSFDWRDKGAVTAVKNQEQCGSCWAFSVTETIESAWYLAGNSLPVLSEQQIVDCDTTDQGCNGGYPTSAYDYIMNAGGLEAEKQYPYEARDGQCQFQKGKVVASIKNYLSATSSKNETQMQMVLYNQGPLSVCVAATSWQTYQGGVVTSCDKMMDHCVQATGFKNMEGKDGKTYPVWAIRNSWSTDWGMDGYIYLERNKDMCDVAELATIPIVDKK